MINPFQTLKDPLVDLLQHSAHRVGNTVIIFDHLQMASSVIKHHGLIRHRETRGNAALCF
jgi:hypothetical protein